jgi:polyisoprenoid-binding protein YceI
MSEDMTTVTGNITIKGITKEIELNTEYNGMSVDPWGNTKHGWEITGTINRNDFGLVWNASLETGGVLVSEKVTLTLDIQMSETVEQTVEQEA